MIEPIDFNQYSLLYSSTHIQIFTFSYRICLSYCVTASDASMKDEIRF